MLNRKYNTADKIFGYPENQIYILYINKNKNKQINILIIV